MESWIFRVPRLQPNCVPSPLRLHNIRVAAGHAPHGREGAKLLSKQLLSAAPRSCRTILIHEAADMQASQRSVAEMPCEQLPTVATS